MGSYKWCYKSPNMGYKWGYKSRNRGYESSNTGQKYIVTLLARPWLEAPNPVFQSTPKPIPHLKS